MHYALHSDHKESPFEMALDISYLNDFYIKSNDLSRVVGPTVLVLAHNEMYSLPVFLQHYRKLGATRFIVVDDASTDGTLDFLSRQPDVMVLGSQRRYGDVVEVVDRADPEGRSVVERRMVHVWRMILPETYTLDRWAVQAAADELLVLPPGRTLPDLFAELNDADFDSIPGIMLDIYPRDIATMRQRSADPAFRMEDDWFFDAERHLAYGSNGELWKPYPGSRARLLFEYLVRPQIPWRARLTADVRWLKHRLGLRVQVPPVNETIKFSLMRWRKGAWFFSAHRHSLTRTSRHVLPIIHLKFTGDLYRRMSVAIKEKSYYKGSLEYKQIAELIEKMEKKNASFLYRNSARIDDIEAYGRVGLLSGFEPVPHAGKA